MPEVEYLTASDVVALTELLFEQLGYARPILRADGRDLLDSAVHRARSVAFYGEADLALQAAVLCTGIIANHPFVDGNKRAAWFACVTFLSNNGHDLSGPETVALADYLIAVYEHDDHGKAADQVANWLRQHAIDLIN
jgi:death on curing protein